ncbi:MAG: hypothetical protein WBW74_27520, partial [Xanthobacteraceae bacterium]
PPTASGALRDDAERNRGRAFPMSGLMQPDRHVDDERLAAVFERLPRLLESDPDLIRRGAFFDARFQVGIGATPFDLVVAAGRIASLERGPFVMRSWRFAVRGSAEAWEQFWKPVPPPGWHDLLALSKRRAMALEGDLQPLMANLQYVKDLLALPRRAGAER